MLYFLNLLFFFGPPLLAVFSRTTMSNLHGVIQVPVWMWSALEINSENIPGQKRNKEESVVGKMAKGGIMKGKKRRRKKKKRRERKDKERQGYILNDMNTGREGSRAFWPKTFIWKIIHRFNSMLI